MHGVLQHFQAAQTIGCVLHGEARLLEVLAHHIGEAVIVFYQEQSVHGGFIMPCDVRACLSKT